MTWHSVATFAVLVGAVSLLVAWEWGGMVRGAGLDTVFFITAAAIIAAIGLACLGEAQWALMAVLAGGIAAGFAGGAASGLAAGLGAIYAGLPALALVWLRAGPTHGLKGVLLVLLVVWATDTGAFIAGRSIGGPRLWAAISPNKTWSGLAGGVAAAGLIAWLVARWAGSESGLQVAVLGMFLAVVSQAGDFVESAIKRRKGVKDASHLIPGHGGFMDRVDGLIFAAIVAALLAAAIDPGHPGAALLALPRS
jgi:phosphatidate cytidylyltransferase